MEKICKELYSNEENGAFATNLKRTDIQKVSTYDYTRYKHQPPDWKEVPESVTENVIHFGETKTYSVGNKYPDMWNENDKDWPYKYGATGVDKECTKWEIIGTTDGEMNDEMKEGSLSTEFKQSYYSHDYKQNEFINDKYHDLIFEKDNENSEGCYWLESRCVALYEDFCSFGFADVNYNKSKGENIVNGLIMFDSNSDRCESIEREQVTKTNRFNKFKN